MNNVKVFIYWWKSLSIIAIYMVMAYYEFVHSHLPLLEFIETFWLFYVVAAFFTILIANFSE